MYTNYVYRNSDQNLCRIRFTNGNRGLVAFSISSKYVISYLIEKSESGDGDLDDY